MVGVRWGSRKGTVSVFDPWLEVARNPHIEVRFARLDNKVVGLTNGADLIWLDERLNQVEQRCVLAHEWRHLLLGHGTCQPLKVEMAVCQWAARKLITPSALAAVWPWSSNLYEMAEELCVTPQTLRDRLHGMTEVEYAMIEGEQEARLVA